MLTHTFGCVLHTETGCASGSAQVWYGGNTAKDVNVHRLVGYVEQYDTHLPLLTVQETLEFSWKCMADTASTVEPVQQVTAARVSNAIRLLGLSNCANTVIGNDLIRGVSGGERKRVTIGEMLMGTYRCLFFGAYRG